MRLISKDRGFSGPYMFTLRRNLTITIIVADKIRKKIFYYALELGL